LKKSWLGWTASNFNFMENKPNTNDPLREAVLEYLAAKDDYARLCVDYQAGTTGAEEAVHERGDRVDQALKVLREIVTGTPTAPVPGYRTHLGCEFVHQGQIIRDYQLLNEQGYAVACAHCEGLEIVHFVCSDTVPESKRIAWRKEILTELGRD
jgi:hypothetical protein